MIDTKYSQLGDIKIELISTIRLKIMYKVENDHT